MCLAFDLLLSFFRAIPKQDIVEEVDEEVTEGKSQNLLLSMHKSIKEIREEKKKHAEPEADEEESTWDQKKISLEAYNMRFTEIVKHHLSSSIFWVDFLSVFPIFTYELWLGWPTDPDTMFYLIMTDKFFYIFAALKLLRIRLWLKAFKHNDELKVFVARNGFRHQDWLLFLINVEVAIIMLIFFLHTAACIWLYFAYIEKSVVRFE
jgi:hypothetical protein